MYRITITPRFKPPIHLPKGFKTKEEALAFANTACEQGCERLRSQLIKKEPSANPYFRYRIIAPLGQRDLAIYHFPESGGSEFVCFYTVEEHLSYSVRQTEYGAKKRTATIKSGIPFFENAEDTMRIVAEKEYARLISRIRSACPQLSEVDGFPFVRMRDMGDSVTIFVQDKDGKELSVMTFEVVGGQDD